MLEENMQDVNTDSEDDIFEGASDVYLAEV